MGKCDGCEDPNKPAVDETSVECCELTPTNCVVTSEYQEYFKIGKGKTMTFVINTIAKFVKALNVRVSTLETAHKYKTLTTTLTQAATDTPTQNVVVNDVGTISPTLARTSAGKYTLTLAGAFTPLKTIIEVKDFNIGWGEKVKAYWVDINTIAIETGSTTDYIDDGILTDTPIEIKIYN